MGRRPCCSKVGMKKGAWTSAEDKILSDYIRLHGEGRWRDIPKTAGLKRCGKSCRLRWLNYLRPDIKRGNISSDEEDLIVRLHKLLGNRWSLIAGRLPGRTDNEIKNYWNTTLQKKTCGNHPTSAIKVPTKRRNKKKKHDKVELPQQNVESNESHLKALKCSDQYIIDTSCTKTLVQSPKDDQSPDLVHDIDSSDICLTELLDFDFSGLLGTDNYRDYEMEDVSCSSLYEGPIMEIVEEFWSVDEQNLYSDSNLYFADCIQYQLV